MKRIEPDWHFLWVINLGLAISLLTQAVRAEAPATVVVGAYVNDIQDIDLREHSYAADIYIWFLWSDAELHPYETVEVVNPHELWGHVRQVIYESPVTMPDGRLYQVVRIQGRFCHKFFFHNFPFDRQELTIELEDSTHETNRLEFVADDSPLVLNPQLKLPGFQVFNSQMMIENFRYPTDFGDTRRTDPNQYSRIRLSIPVKRPALTSSIKLLLPLFCVVLGASLMLALRVTYVDARLSVGITSLLTVVAIQLASNDTLPSADYLVLMDKIHLCAYGYVLSALAIVWLTIRRVDQNQIEAAQNLQRHGFWTITLSFITSVALLIAWAMWQG
ncbi:MAG: hypothetical protein KF752_06125 [Pirellulaceae bacterium]|nr:hypothetical protein [Pirellulaceae bacterium]